MERYRVRGQRRVDAICAAIEASGGTIVRCADPTSAPFEFDILLPDRRPLRLICYAFTANKYSQAGRPSDEHRFQVKYGSEFDRPHRLQVGGDETVTLFFGVYEDGDLFVAADPALHNPTWFSSSIEFKEADATTGRELGWHAWQRDRMPRGRRRVNPDESLITETLHAFAPRHFLTYARFEDIATGMAPGERLLLFQDIGRDLAQGQVARALVERQIEASSSIADAMVKAMGLPVDQLLAMIAKSRRLRTAMRGGVAEHHLHNHLRRTRSVTHLEKLDQDGQPDFALKFRGRYLKVECKLVSPTLTRGLPRVDFQKTRASKSDPCSRYYAPSQFEILAACLHPVSDRWEFRFTLTATMAQHRKCPGKLSDRVLVAPSWPPDLPTLPGT